ncbi:predicted protein [Plenodomus lingam JN3]|uniref:Predicted protein n=2 Tax=Leptosphaeria maculans TaxID=5022 RepID=E5A4P4_LEPMJ|nr:predicted protein [Plenodomus lingam JN3]CBX98592.1 predicted protein [Plenodomus lingam JN3]
MLWDPDSVVQWVDKPTVVPDNGASFLTSVVGSWTIIRRQQAVWNGSFTRRVAVVAKYRSSSERLLVVEMHTAAMPVVRKAFW